MKCDKLSCVWYVLINLNLESAYVKPHAAEETSHKSKFKPAENRCGHTGRKLMIR